MVSCNLNQIGTNWIGSEYTNSWKSERVRKSKSFLKPDKYDLVWILTEGGLIPSTRKAMILEKCRARCLLLSVERIL